MRKRILSLILMIVIIMSIISIGTFSVSAETSDYYTYTINDGEATITDVDTSISGDVIIPSTLGGYPVTCIGKDAFGFCLNVTSVEIPDGVTTIDKLAFQKCSAAKINIPSSVTKIGNYAFSDCVQLGVIDIPSSVTSIGDGVFYECGNLIRITVEKNNAYYSSDEYGVLFNKNKTELIQYPAGNTRSSYSVPKGVTSLDSWAFYVSKNLKVIELPDTVTSIGEAAFRFCTSLKNINIPNGVTSISACTFEQCQSLTSIKIPEGVTSIGDIAFWFCGSLKSIELPKSLKNIVESAFSCCDSLTDVYYSGSKADWNKIYIDKGNEPLISANMHYNLGIGTNQSASKSNATEKNNSSSATLISVNGEVESTEDTTVASLYDVGEIDNVSVNSQNSTVEPEKKDNKTVLIFSTVAAVVILAVAAAIIAYKTKNKEKV